MSTARSKDELKEHLECPICLQVLSPPIYQCQTGHTICKGCKPKLKQCPNCQSPYMETRNFLVESIVLAAKFYCNHRRKGCNIYASLDNIQKHHRQCAFRPMKCHLNGLDGCTEAKLYLSDYVNHLKLVHNRKVGENTIDKPNVFVTTYNSSLKQWKTAEEDILTWDGELYNFDGKVFVSLIRNNGPIFHIGFFLIGDKSDASKYNVKITIQKTANTENTCKYELTSPFPSLRDFVEQGQDLPLVGVVHKDFIDSVGQMSRKNEILKSQFRWRVQYEILMS